MEFLGSLPTDVRFLLVGGALALLAGLLTGTKRNERRYMALFTVLMIAAGVRFHLESRQQQVSATPGSTEARQLSGGAAKSALR